MVNYPKSFGTKEDVLNCIELYPERIKAYLQVLLSEVKQWILVKKLEEGEVGIEDELHKIIEIKEDEAVKERYQYEFKEFEGCELFRLGFSVEEVEKILEG